MNFVNTKQYVYRKCVDRVELKRKSETPVKPQIALCPNDKSLVSCFFNCHPSINNKYLVTKRLLKYHDKDTQELIGAVPVFGFKNENEVLWGTEDEFDDNLFTIFTLILKDLILSNYIHLDQLDLVLSDNIIYAKYSTLYQIKKDHEISLLKYFAVYDEMVSSKNMDNYLDIALKYLYKKDGFMESFKKIFRDYTSKYKDYTHFDHRLEKEFLPNLLDLFNKYAPLPSSLGLRVKNLIKTDLIKTIDLINAIDCDIEQTPDSELKKKIINASSLYITKLEEIAYQMEQFSVFTYNW